MILNSVWVLAEWYWGDYGCNVLGVYSSKELAELDAKNYHEDVTVFGPFVVQDEP